LILRPEERATDTVRACAFAPMFLFFSFRLAPDELMWNRLSCRYRPRKAGDPVNTIALRDYWMRRLRAQTRGMTPGDESGTIQTEIIML
jgi:hypothetical protein